MRLAAIYSVWDGEELLKGSINCLNEHVDVLIIIYQTQSNFGEKYDPLSEILKAVEGCKTHVVIKEFEPQVGVGGTSNEKNKRNLGLTIAKELGCSHFLFVDVDEYYEDFGMLKEAYVESGAKGSVCKLFTYFKKPTLRFENQDNYWVPFIHRLRPDTIAGVREYPFYVDPTRKVNETDVAEMPMSMHHFSWVRKDIEKKCRNSSARRNIERTTLLQGYLSEECGDGFLVKDYQNMRLIEVENIFGISDSFN